MNGTFKFRNLLTLLLICHAYS